MNDFLRTLRLAACVLPLLGCGPIEGQFVASPERFDIASWTSVELTLEGLPPRATLDVGADGLVVRDDVRIGLGSAAGVLLGVDGDIAHVGLGSIPSPGFWRVVVTNANGRWESVNQLEVYGVGGEDGGVGDGSATDGAVGTGVASEVPGLDVIGRCEADPALTHDGRWLLFARSRGASCNLSARDIYVYEWNHGVPTDTGVTITLTDLGGLPLSAGPFDGAAMGAPGTYGFVFATAMPSGGELVVGSMVGDPPSPPATTSRLRAGISPSLTPDMAVMVFTQAATLYETHEPLVADSSARPMTELTGDAPSDPTISADGLMLAYAAAAAPGADRDIYVARRARIDDVFGPSAPLPRGPDLVNSDQDDGDPSFTPDGGLLFTSERSGPNLIYFCRRLSVPTAP